MVNYSRSTCLNHAEYLRKVALGQRITIFYRNKSFDEFLDEAIRLRNEMQTVREKLPAAIPDLSVLIALQEKIKTILIQIFNHVRQNKDQQTPL